MKTENEGTEYGGRLWPDNQGSLPPPPSVNRGGRSSVWKFIAAIGGIAVLIAGVTFVATNSSPGRTVGPQVVPPSTAAAADEPGEDPEVGTGDPTVPDSSSEVFGTFNAPNGWTFGSDLRFGVLWIRYPWPKCYTHALSTGGKPRGAFYSDCAWDDYDLAFFRVNFKNRSGHSIRLTRFNLMLHTSDGRNLTPVDVGATNKFLSKPRTLSWNSQWTGWVAFDNSGVEVHPISMSYQLGDETLTQVFEGSESVVGPR
jgi:hypothetical protein